MKNPPKVALMLLLFSIMAIATSQAQNYLKLPDDIKPKDRICFAMYTVHENTLKMTAQFYPIKDFEPFSAILQVKNNDTWDTVAISPIEYPGYTAHFRVESWDDSQEKEYRVVHNNNAFYEGLVRKNPKEKDEIVMAAFSCFSMYDKHGGQIPVTDIIDNLKKIKPDVLFFSGDQVYDHSQHYLNWLKFGEAFGELIRNTPTICMPDDHDIGQGNLWGNGGKKIDNRHGSDGGYYMPVSYIKEVERAQTSHLPDPYDPTPIEQGIGVYYTGYTWGGMSFALIEDRKFKTGPDRIIKNKKVDDTRLLDVPEATLLGQRQLDFLENWTTDWKDAEMKVVLSQTIFASVSTHSPTRKNRQRFSFDSNGWPQTGRNKALSIIRKSYACMIAGDQHLGSVVRHGVEDWNNAGYSFAVPAVANFWMRYWEPETPGKNRKPGSPTYTGEFLDGLQNKITVHAISNPTFDDNTPKEDLLNGRASGYGVIRFKKSAREITYECWPRNTDMATENPYPGWSVSFSQLDNFHIENGYELPTIETSSENQVITVMDQYTSEVVSSLRVKGNSWKPKVLNPGTYKIAIGEGENMQLFYEIEAKSKNKEVLKITTK
ncbi:alkaline phosphatase D family protein [Flammeovirgaceae bacterium SG7u.111]|nr:alkaline phosphatase D family protein [Flammeovirgaceae bacterium SG7u.132]WPO37910.1 alkaline phosphatase D family protein [Flammeovirgaceae bacterium SG7u.111]